MFQAGERILRYLKGTLGHGLLLKPFTYPSLIAYADADWAGCPDSRPLQVMLSSLVAIIYHGVLRSRVSRSSAES